MPNIHVAGSNYTAPATIQGWQWLPFSDNALINTLKSALYIIESQIKGENSCELEFAKLPLGRSFTDLWNSNSIWISYDPDRSGTKYGVTFAKKHISITAYALKMGKWITAATLIHELAHVNGAPGNNTQAEDTLLRCGLKNHHNPNIIDRLEQQNNRRPYIA